MRSQSKTRRPRPTEGPAGEKRQDHLGFVSRGCETTAKHVRSIKKEATRQPATAFLRPYTPEWARHSKGKARRLSPGGVLFLPRRSSTPGAETKHPQSRLIQDRWFGVSACRGGTMCEQCGEIDGKIARYRRIMMSIGDEVTIERFKEVIADLEAQKLALHTEQEQ